MSDGLYSDGPKPEFVDIDTSEVVSIPITVKKMYIGSAFGLYMLLITVKIIVNLCMRSELWSCYQSLLVST